MAPSLKTSHYECPSVLTQTSSSYSGALDLLCSHQHRLHEPSNEGAGGAHYKSQETFQAGPQPFNKQVIYGKNKANICQGHLRKGKMKHGRGICEEIKFSASCQRATWGSIFHCSHYEDLSNQSAGASGGRITNYVIITTNFGLPRALSTHASNVPFVLVLGDVQLFCLRLTDITASFQNDIQCWYEVSSENHYGQWQQSQPFC